MFRLGRDKLRERATPFGVDRSQAALSFEAFDLVKQIGQTCDRSATVRPACRTLNRRMVTAVEPVYSACSSTHQSSMQTPRHIGIDLHRNQFTCGVRIGEWPELSDGMEAGGFAAVCEELKKVRPDDEIAVEVRPGQSRQSRWACKFPETPVRDRSETH